MKDNYQQAHKWILHPVSIGLVAAGAIATLAFPDIYLEIEKFLHP